MKNNIVRILAIGLFLGALFSSTISMASAEISRMDICDQYLCVPIEDPLRHLGDPDCPNCGGKYEIHFDLIDPAVIGSFKNIDYNIDSQVKSSAIR